MASINRDLTPLDHACLQADKFLRAVFGHAKSSGRPYPARHAVEGQLSPQQKKSSAALMRVNHAGEVSAQALYQAQSLTCRSPQLKESMIKAAQEEGDHLAWCKLRLDELGGHVSYLNFFWYTGSFAIGLVAGIISDKWSLSFLAETETQVVLHLEKHLNLLSDSDIKSHLVLKQMQADEAAHRDEAMARGGTFLPLGVKKIMGLLSQIMVKTAYVV